MVAAMNNDLPRPFCDIADRIRWHREEIMSMTQNEYADRCGFNRPSLAAYEAGIQRLSISSAIKLCKLHGLTLDWLYFGDDSALPLSLRAAWREELHSH
jgi:DNA-binding XRE family transcriptional regulator